MEFEMLQSIAPVTGYRIYNGEAKRRKKGKSIAVSLSQATDKEIEIRPDARANNRDAVSPGLTVFWAAPKPSA